MSAVLDLPQVLAPKRTLAKAPVVTPRDRERVQALIQKSVALSLVEPAGACASTPFAQTLGWKPGGSRGLLVLEGIVSVAVMGYFLCGLGSVLMGV